MRCLCGCHASGTCKQAAALGDLGVKSALEGCPQPSCRRCRGGRQHHRTALCSQAGSWNQAARSAHPPCFRSMKRAQMEMRKKMPPSRPPKAPVYSAIHGRFLMFFCAGTLKQVIIKSVLSNSAELTGKHSTARKSSEH